MKWRTLGKFLGVTFKDETSTETEKKEPDNFTFKDPEEYKHLSKQQKVELTKKMKLSHVAWSRKFMTIGKTDAR